MIRHPFDYVAPSSLKDAVEAIADGEAMVIGGGTVLVPLLSLGELAPARLVDTRFLPIHTVEDHEGDLAIGAAASYDTVADSPAASKLAPLLGLVSRGITGGRQLTCQASFGGSACYASPASEAPACLMALDARMILHSRDGERTVDASTFFLGPFQTARRPDELLTKIVLPKPGRWRHASYLKQKHCTSSWPIVTAIALVDDLGTIRVTVGCAAARPFTVAVQLSSGNDHRLAGLAAQAVSDTLSEAWGDSLASSAYRRRIAPALAARIVTCLLKGVFA